jgi:hypothetical protein
MMIFIVLLVVVGIVAVAAFFGYKQIRKLQDNMNVMFHRQTQTCTMADVDQEVEKRVKSEVDKAMNLERRRLQEMQETYVDMIETLRAGERGVPTGRPAPSRTTDTVMPSPPQSPSKHQPLPKKHPPIITRRVIQPSTLEKDDSDNSSSSSDIHTAKTATMTEKKKKRKDQKHYVHKAKKDKKKNAARDHDGEDGRQESAVQSKVEVPERPTSSRSSREKRARVEPAIGSASDSASDTASDSSVSDIDDVIVQTMSDVSMSDLIVGQ